MFLVVFSLRHIFGVAVRYNLTVADDHTYAVGATAVVVHNITCSDVIARINTNRRQNPTKGSNYGGWAILNPQGQVVNFGTSDGYTHQTLGTAFHAEQQSMARVNLYFNSTGGLDNREGWTINIYTELPPCTDACVPFMINSPYAQSIAQEVLRDRSSDKLDCRALR